MKEGSGKSCSRIFDTHFAYNITHSIRSTHTAASSQRLCSQALRAVRFTRTRVAKISFEFLLLIKLRNCMAHP